MASRVSKMGTGDIPSGCQGERKTWLPRISKSGVGRSPPGDQTVAYQFFIVPSGFSRGTEYHWPGSKEGNEEHAHAPAAKAVASHSRTVILQVRIVGSAISPDPPHASADSESAIQLGTTIGHVGIAGSNPFAPTTIGR